MLALVGGCGHEETPGAQAPTGKAQKPAQGVKTPIQYKLVRSFDSGLELLKGIALDSADRIYLAGRQGVRVLTPSGKRLSSWATPQAAQCVAVSDADGTIYVGLAAKVLRYDRDGKLLGSWGRKGKGRGELSVVTAIAVHGDRVYVADAGNRCVHRFDFRGDFINEVGKHDPKTGFVGLVCPSPFLDCAAERETGILHVTNPGLLRVERYRPDGELLGHWGEAGEQPHQFVGCCNPTNLALLPGGRVATAEKVVPRVKVFGPGGRMLAYVGPEHFSRDAAGLDLAADSHGRLYVADPGDGKVRVFEEAQ